MAGGDWHQIQFEHQFEFRRQIFWTCMQLDLTSGTQDNYNIMGITKTCQQDMIQGQGHSHNTLQTFSIPEF